MTHEDTTHNAFYVIVLFCYLQTYYVSYMCNLGSFTNLSIDYDKNELCNVYIYNENIGIINVTEFHLQWPCHYMGDLSLIRCTGKHIVSPMTT